MPARRGEGGGKPPRLNPCLALPAELTISLYIPPLDQTNADSDHNSSRTCQVSSIRCFRRHRKQHLQRICCALPRRAAQRRRLGQQGHCSGQPWSSRQQLPQCVCLVALGSQVCCCTAVQAGAGHAAGSQLQQKLHSLCPTILGCHNERAPVVDGRWLRGRLRCSLQQQQQGWHVALGGCKVGRRAAT